MPIDYKDYPDDWKDRIRPDILDRDGHRCKFWGVPNHQTIWRRKAAKTRYLKRKKQGQKELWEKSK